MHAMRHSIEPRQDTMSDKKKILLAYIGDEQGSWGNIAFTRPAHYYIMPGILYCGQALRNDPEIAGRCEISCRFFNRNVQSIDAIAESIRAGAYDLVGFSSYCWNIGDNLSLARTLRQVNPSARIILGGPEAAMRTPEECDAFFTANGYIDSLVFGEAERRIASVVKALLFDDRAALATVKGAAFSPRFGRQPSCEIDYVLNPTDIPSIYPFEYDIPRSRECGLAMVYETGRGCPFRCIYCRFGHRNHKPYRFDIDRVRDELIWLFGRGIDCVHFADAVFDLDPSYAKEVMRIIDRHNISSSIFFYCSFARLDEELAEMFSKSQCQIGVGVQSANPDVLRAIRRSLSPGLFSRIGGILEKHSVNFYTDLIFGLPGDSPESFRRSFEQTLGLKPSFVMLFPLTLIKGTPLGDRPEAFGVRRFDAAQVKTLDLMCDISYENIGLGGGFSIRDLVEFDDIALTLFYFYNRFPYALGHLGKRAAGDRYRLYRDIGRRTKEFLRRVGRTASNTDFIEGFADEIFAIFAALCESYGAGPRERTAFHELFKLDIIRILILGSPLREKIFRAASGGRAENPAAQTTHSVPSCRALVKTHGKILTLPYRLCDLLNLERLGETIQHTAQTVYMHAPFGHWNATVAPVSAVERFLIEFIPSDRAVGCGRIIQAAQKHFCGRSAGDAAVEAETLIDTLLHLARRDIVALYSA